MLISNVQKINYLVLSCLSFETQNCNDGIHCHNYRTNHNTSNFAHLLENYVCNSGEYIYN